MDFLHTLHKDCTAHIGYPGNHDLFVCRGKLVPGRKLHARYKTLSKYYPKQLKSFLDLSSCRGYFVLTASKTASCERSLGIDVNSDEIQLCKNLKEQLNLPKSQFEKKTLSELADNIEQFGGPYQTVMLANTYQYLYFGSELAPGYLSHDKIFEYFSRVCSGRFIFTNRVEKSDCQNKTQVMAAGHLAEDYNRDAILKSASKYFKLMAEERIGKYPLFVFERKA